MSRREEVKALHGFEAWGDHIDDDAGFDGPTPLFLTDHERLFDLHFLAREALHPEGGSTRGYREYYEAEDRPDAGVMVIVRQLPSIKDAHEALVDILETSMALRLVPAEEREVSVGHVAFVGHDPTVDAIHFVRGSTLVTIKNTGGEIIPVAEMAEEIDRQLTTHLMNAHGEQLPAR